MKEENYCNEEENKEINMEEEEICKTDDTLDDVEILDFSLLIDEVKKEKDELLGRLQRSLAEFDNFRKRTEKEKETLYNTGIDDFATRILPVIDNFERAIDSFQNKEDGIYEGFTLILKQLLSILKDMEITQIDADAKEFDIYYHHAVAKVDSDTTKSNHIVEVIQKGYMHGEKVLRFSMVTVAN